MIPIKISTNWLNKKFLCSYDYILKECKGRCCQSSDKILISLLPNEINNFIELGRKVENNLLCADSRNICPEKNDNGLCNLHNTHLKPFGCIASPFTINKNNTLIIRYRYSRLKCFGNGEPAYKVFKPSLDLIFGKDESERICKEIQENKTDIIANITEENLNKIKYLDKLK